MSFRRLYTFSEKSFFSSIYRLVILSKKLYLCSKNFCWLYSSLSTNYCSTFYLCSSLKSSTLWISMTLSLSAKVIYWILRLRKQCKSISAYPTTYFERCYFRMETLQISFYLKIFVLYVNFLYKISWKMYLAGWCYQYRIPLPTYERCMLYFGPRERIFRAWCPVSYWSSS